MLHQKWRGTIPRSGLGSFAVAGRRGLVAGSYDGVTFQTPMETPLSSITHIALGPNCAVVLGYTGTNYAAAFTKDNGSTWSTLTAAHGVIFNGTYILRGVKYGNGQFVVIGEVSGSGSAPRACFTSPDGETWTNRTTSLYNSGLAGSGNGGTTQLQDIDFGNGVHVVCGRNTSNSSNMKSTAWSADGGITWAGGNGPLTGAEYPYGSGYQAAWSAMHMGNGTWLATSFGTSFSGYAWFISRDGAKNWTNESIAGSSFGTQAKHGAGTGTVFVAAAGTITKRSTDLLTWTSTTTGLSGSVYDVHHNGTAWFVCDGSSTIAHSLNGTDWDTTDVGFSVYAMSSFKL